MRLTSKDLTLERKIEILQGKNSWQTNDFDGQVPAIFVADGPHGLRKVEITGERVKATAYPTLSSIGNSWNIESAYEMGKAIADDCIEHDVDILLAPGLNMKRTPLCGRNFEYFAEDPYLAGKLGYNYVDGVQSKGVGTSVKHFAANNREIYRLQQSSEVDERTLFEIYTKAFEMTVKAKPYTVMCSYNPVNGIYAAENRYLLKDVLRDKLGYDGLIVSDWGAVRNGAKSVKATLDLHMPKRNEHCESIKCGLDSGYITEQELDERVDKILDLIYKCKGDKDKRKITLTKEQRHEKAVELAKDTIVLLKNEDNILPLNKKSKIDVFHLAEGDAGYMGGGGSAYVVTDYPLQYLDKTLENLGYKTTIYRDATVAGEFDDGDIAIVCVGHTTNYEGEGFDRKTIKLPPVHENLIRSVASVHENTVVVLSTGSAIDMTGWIDQVKAVVQTGFNGEGTFEATASVLSGETCPSGKLAETYPLCLEDTPTKDYVGDGHAELYSEGLFIGYRYYDKYKKDVLFPFGYGLSYAKFEYSNLAIEKLGETDYVVCYDITNTSKVDGKEVSQIYVSDPSSMVVRPVKELKGFSKDLIKAGETKRISVKLDKDAFAYYSANLKDWHVENGIFEIMVGASSRDIKLKQKIKIQLPFETQYIQDTLSWYTYANKSQYEK